MKNLLNELNALIRCTDADATLQELEHLSDLVEYHQVTFEEDINEIMYTLIDLSISAVNADLQEAALSLAVNLLTFNTINIELNLDILLNKMNLLDNISLEAAIALFGFSKNARYLKVLTDFSCSSNLNIKLAAADALSELKHSVK